MIDFLKALFFVPRCWKYIWRCEGGGWYIFRDAPDDIVEYFAKEYVPRNDQDGRYVWQALAELRLREFQRASKEMGRAE